MKVLTLAIIYCRITTKVLEMRLMRSLLQIVQWQKDQAKVVLRIFQEVLVKELVRVRPRSTEI